MAHCIRCGTETWPGRRICHNCMSKWTEMRKVVFEFLQNKYGKMCPENLSILQKEIKRLDKLWKRDPEKFYKEIAPEEISEAQKQQPTSAGSH